MGTILYIHGMGGGVDSRTPRALNELLEGAPVVIRNYDFNPAVALLQIEAWIEELHPALIVSESMGANYGILIGEDIPHIYLSPAFGAPGRFAALSLLALVPGVPQLLSRHFKPRPGERQKLDFHYSTIKNFRRLDRLVKSALEKERRALSGKAATSEAYFGRHDPYLRNGIVSIRHWQHFFGEKHCHVDDEAHFWEKERVLRAGLDQKISAISGHPCRNTH